jgi:hypothetical protein
MDVGSTSKSNFVITLGREINQVDKIEIDFVEIPYTFYSVNATNNVVEIRHDESADIKSGAIAAGNYSPTTMAVALKTLLDTIDDHSDAGTYTVTYSSITHKFTIARSVGTFEIVKNSGSTLYGKLGFSGSVGASITHTGDQVINLLLTKYINIRSDSLTRYLTVPNVEYGTYRNLLCTVPMTGSPTDIIICDDLKSLISLNHRISFTTVDLKLEDSLGNELDLNGHDWSIVLIFHVG